MSESLWEINCVRSVYRDERTLSKKRKHKLWITIRKRENPIMQQHLNSKDECNFKKIIKSLIKTLKIITDRFSNKPVWYREIFFLIIANPCMMVKMTVNGLSKDRMNILQVPFSFLLILHLCYCDPPLIKVRKADLYVNGSNTEMIWKQANYIIHI